MVCSFSFRLTKRSLNKNENQDSNRPEFLNYSKDLLKLIIKQFLNAV